MKRYEKYKASDIPWLPKIPAHWGEKRLKSLFSKRNEPYSPNESLQVLSLLKDVGIIPYSEKGNVGNKAKDDITTYNVARKGDIVMNSMNVIIGSVDITPFDGYISPAYYALYSNDGVSTEYYNYLFHLKAVQQQMRCLANGILEIRLRISSTKMFGMYYPFPPLVEQKKIVAYLNERIPLIESCKYQRERELQTLNELKQARIASAVTRGLNPNVPMKDSEIPLIGQIPAHWETRALRNVSLEWIRGNGVTRDQVTEDGVACVRYGELYTEYNYSFDKAVSHTMPEFIPSAKYVVTGDILFAMTGEKIEEIGKSLAYTGNEKCILGGDIMAMRHSQNPLYLSYVLSTPSAAWQKGKGRQKLKVLHTTLNNLRNVFIPLPPIDEQNEIVNYIQSKIKQIDKMIDALKAEIDRFTEYKQRLISDVVTGQINVQD